LQNCEGDVATAFTLAKPSDGSCRAWLTAQAVFRLLRHLWYHSSVVAPADSTCVPRLLLLFNAFVSYVLRGVTNLCAQCLSVL